MLAGCAAQSTGTTAPAAPSTMTAATARTAAPALAPDMARVWMLRRKNNAEYPVFGAGEPIVYISCFQALGPTRLGLLS